MKQNSMLIPTLRDNPSDADIKSHQLLLRAGFIRQNAAGVYSFLPLGNRVLKKVEHIVREEMDRAGAQEVLLPALQPAELWKESGRWEDYGPELMRLKDRHDREFALGATHEEVMTSLMRDEVKSYKKLPMILYQIQTKFRDEKRPRFGILRGREFLMKDAYSFDTTQEGLDESYQKMYDAYMRIFTRLGLNFRAVIADSGAMGGKDTHEFMALSEIGEDTIAYSNESSFAANIEKAECLHQYELSDEEKKELQLIDTLEYKSVEEVASFLDVPKKQLIKSLLFIADEEFVLVLVRGDHEVNDIKLKNFLHATQVTLASPELTKETIGCEIGNIGPVQVPKGIKVVADFAVQSVVNGVCGANKEGKHYENANVNRDFVVDAFADLRFIKEGDPSPDGKGTVQFARGIEIGHVFKLGTRYSESMGALYLDEQGKSQPMIMGSYGIGVSRLLSAIVEQSNDEHGIIWPIAVTPFHVHLIPVNIKNEEQKEVADSLYESLQNARFDVLYDDRKERPGVKFADSDLIGLPVRVTVGKKASDGIVEVKVRQTGEVKEVEVKDLISELNTIFESL